MTLLPADRFPGRIRAVTLGATASEGGTRQSTVTLGGASGMPYLHFDGEHPRPPAIAMEVYDQPLARYPAVLTDLYGDLLQRPVDMARRCVEEFGTDLISVRLEGTHPEKGDRSAEQASELVGEVLAAVGVPLMVVGHSHFERTNEVLRKVAEDHAGERLLLGWVETDNYRTVAAAALAYGHCLVALSPVDFNIAKQLNILLGNMDVPLDRVVMDPMTGALGYGNEYTYSVMERLRLGALGGDDALQSPMLVAAGWECLRTKESAVSGADYPLWGDIEQRFVHWEVGTAASLLLAGGDLLCVNHPDSVRRLRALAAELTGRA